MSIAIIGGLNRLKLNYENIPKKLGIRAKVYNQLVPDFTQRISSMDVIVLFTGTVAHNMVKKVIKMAKNNNIPVIRSHTSSISGLKRCLSEIQAF
jgi:hypothetical protein